MKKYKPDILFYSIFNNCKRKTFDLELVENKISDKLFKELKAIKVVMHRHRLMYPNVNT